MNTIEHLLIVAALAVVAIVLAEFRHRIKRLEAICRQLVEDVEDCEDRIAILNVTDEDMAKALPWEEFKRQLEEEREDGSAHSAS